MNARPSSGWGDRARDTFEVALPVVVLFSLLRHLVSLFDWALGTDVTGWLSDLPEVFHDAYIIILAIALAALLLSGIVWLVTKNIGAHGEPKRSRTPRSKR